MLRLIGAIVILLLLVGPLLAQAGLLSDAGLLRDFVTLEVRTFLACADWVRNLISSHTSP